MKRVLAGTMFGLVLSLGAAPADNIPFDFRQIALCFLA
jgi:hypothetical protein